MRATERERLKEKNSNAQNETERHCKRQKATERESSRKGLWMG